VKIDARNFELSW